MELGISNRPENVLDLIVLSLVCTALFTVEINVFVPFTPITDRLSNRKCTNALQVGSTFDPLEAPFISVMSKPNFGSHMIMQMEIRKMEFKRRIVLFSKMGLFWVSKRVKSAPNLVVVHVICHVTESRVHSSILATLLLMETRSKVLRS